MPKATQGGATGGLDQEKLLDEVEALMQRLALGAAPEPTGRVICEHLATGGKRLRARLALAAVGALGADAADAVGWAAACESLHNATLVHDDVQDGDRVRRGAPTVWAAHGIPMALNVGDLMFLLPIEAIAAVARPAEVRAQLCRALAEQGGAVIRGQTAEAEMGRAVGAGAGSPVDLYLRAIEGKTSALFVLPVEGAAVIAGLPDAAVAGLRRPFSRLGMFFQMQDDVLDLYGDKGREAPGADLYEGKISALVVEHLALHPDDRDWLLAVLRAPRGATPEAEVARAIARFRDGGALAAVLARIERLADEARGDPIFATYPKVGELLAELSERVLAPIAGVRAGAGRSGSK